MKRGSRVRHRRLRTLHRIGKRTGLTLADLYGHRRTAECLAARPPLLPNRRSRPSRCIGPLRAARFDIVRREFLWRRQGQGQPAGGPPAHGAGTPGHRYPGRKHSGKQITLAPRRPASATDAVAETTDADGVAGGRILARAIRTTTLTVVLLEGLSRGRAIQTAAASAGGKKQLDRLCPARGARVCRNARALQKLDRLPRP